MNNDRDSLKQMSHVLYSIFDLVAPDDPKNAEKRAEAVKAATGYDERMSTDLLNRIVIAAGSNPVLLQKLRQVGRLHMSYEENLLHLSRSEVEQLTSGLKTSHQLNAVLAACLEAGMMIVRLGEDPKNVKEWLSYYIKDVIKLLPPPPKKRWWNLFAG